MREEKITKVVEIKYIADDGKEFHSKEKCMEYEQSKIFLAKKGLKMLCNTTAYQFLGSGSDEDGVEIFDIQTEQDLKKLKKYVYIKLKENNVSNNDIKDIFTSVDGKRKDYVLNGLTFGHEVILFWSYDEDWCYTYRDGSIEGYFQYVRDCMQESFDSYKGR